MGNEQSTIAFSASEIAPSFHAPEYIATLNVHSNGEQYSESNGIYQVTKNSLTNYNPMSGHRRYHKATTVPLSSSDFRATSSIGCPIIAVGTYSGGCLIYNANTGEIVRNIQTQEAMEMVLVLDDLDKEFGDSTEKDLDDEFDDSGVPTAVPAAPDSVALDRESEGGKRRSSSAASSKPPAGAPVITAVKLATRNIVITGDVQGHIRAFSIQDRAQLWHAFPFIKYVEDTSASSSSSGAGRRGSRGDSAAAPVYKEVKDNGVTSLAYLGGDIPRVAAAFADCSIHIYNAGTGKFIKSLSNSDSPMSHIALTNRWPLLFGITVSKKVVVCKVTNDSEVHPLRELFEAVNVADTVTSSSSKGDRVITAIHVDDDAELIVSGYSDGSVDLHKLKWNHEIGDVDCSLWRVFTVATAPPASPGVPISPSIPWITSLAYDSIVDCLVIGDITGNIRVITEVTSTKIDRRRSTLSSPPPPLGLSPAGSP